MVTIDKEQELNQLLSQYIGDDVLSRSERRALQADIALYARSDKNALRSRAFAWAKQRIDQNISTDKVFKWLEELVKLIDRVEDDDIAEAYFSPGTQVRDRLIALCHHAKQTLDICVFTISDDKLCDAIVSAHKRGVHVRVITDDLKSEDSGSDIAELNRQGVCVRMDDSDAHMHHKFVVRDGIMLASGSFNWTRSATTHNQENEIVTNNKQLVAAYCKEFEKLWLAYQ